jgi:beta-lactamase regulating signal transducer with metallopeptidase domain
MIGLPVQAAAEIWVGRVLNSLPAGFLIALFAWMVLRFWRRQNSGTRFAVWFVALLTIAVLPLMGGFGRGQSLLATGLGLLSAGRIVRAAISLPAGWALYIFLAWFAVAFVAMLRLMVGLWRLHVLRRSCAEIDTPSLDPAVRKTVDEFSGSRSVAIATSESVRVPAAIGFWKPMIVIPDWALRELPPDELNIILLHEHAHLRRWDDWTNLVQKTVRALFFFHPAMWWIENRLSVEREMACDDAVLAETRNPHGYASCLVSLLEKNLAHRGWVMAQAVVHRAHEASLRLAQILDTNRPVATRGWKPALGLVGGFAIACLALSPHTPSMVVFRQSATNSATNAIDVTPRAVGRSVQLQSAAVVPATLKSGSLARKTTAKANPVRVVVKPRLAPVLSVETRLPAAPTRAHMVAVNSREDQYSAPPAQMLIFVQTTESVGPNAWVWHVEVWRVTIVSPTPDQSVSGAVSHST